MFVKIFYVLSHYEGFDTNLLADALFKHFGPGTIYEDARQQSGSPVKGPWTNHCLKIMIANRENGQSPEGDPKSQDPDGLCKAIALVCLLGGTGDYSDKVEGCVQTAQVSGMICICLSLANAKSNLLGYP